eukprot:scaffold9414_cov156-Isochrysis_galbana.AAC.6
MTPMHPTARPCPHSNWCLRAPPYGLGCSVSWPGSSVPAWRLPRPRGAGTTQRWASARWA